MGTAMSKHDHRNLFHECVEALAADASTSPTARYIASTVAHGQRFILPDAGEMVIGNPIEKFSESLRHLPYPEIALLRFKDLGGHTYPQIVAASAGALANVPDDGFVLASCFRVQHRGRRMWVPGGLPFFVKARGDGQVFAHDFAGLADEERNRVLSALTEHGKPLRQGAFVAITELLVLLSLANVGTKLIEPACELNRKRLARDRLPLYDYHVLTIAGREVFDRGGSGFSDRTLRSHYRRGHIRRLNDGRHVWVRNTIVHGKRPGFVDKDYDLTKVARSAQ